MYALWSGSGLQQLRRNSVHDTLCVCFGQTLKLDKFHVVAFASSSSITIKVTMNAPDRLDALAVPDDIPK